MSEHTATARYWYDGTYVNTAKEDAAEVALRTSFGFSSDWQLPLLSIFSRL